MAKKNKKDQENVTEEVIEETAEVQEEQKVEEPVEVNPFEEKYNADHDAHLRLAA